MMALARNATPRVMPARLMVFAVLARLQGRGQLVKRRMDRSVCAVTAAMRISTIQTVSLVMKAAKRVGWEGIPALAEAVQPMEQLCRLIVGSASALAGQASYTRIAL